MRCLEEKQKNIGCTKKYVGDQEVKWWGNFFNHQHTILVNHLVGYWPLQFKFKWNIGAPSYLIFIPAILPEVGVEQLQWTRIDDNVTFAYMGRRLECKNKNLTFLTPGLFPRIQALFSNAFQSKDDNASITLG